MSTTSASPQSSTTNPQGFLKLPLEIRQIIYTLIIPGDIRNPTRFAPDIISLFQTHSQIYQEARQWIYPLWPVQFGIVIDERYSRGAGRNQVICRWENPYNRARVNTSMEESVLHTIIGQDYRPVFDQMLAHNGLLQSVFPLIVDMVRRPRHLTPWKSVLCNPFMAHITILNINLRAVDSALGDEAQNLLIVRSHLGQRFGRAFPALEHLRIHAKDYRKPTNKSQLAAFFQGFLFSPFLKEATLIHDGQQPQYWQDLVNEILQRNGGRDCLWLRVRGTVFYHSPGCSWPHFYHNDTPGQLGYAAWTGELWVLAGLQKEGDNSEENTRPPVWDDRAKLAWKKGYAARELLD